MIYDLVFSESFNKILGFLGKLLGLREFTLLETLKTIKKSIEFSKRSTLMENDKTFSYNKRFINQIGLHILKI